MAKRYFTLAVMVLVGMLTATAAAQGGLGPGSTAGCLPTEGGTAHCELSGTVSSETNPAISPLLQVDLSLAGMVGGISFGPDSGSAQDMGDTSPSGGLMNETAGFGAIWGAVSNIPVFITPSPNGHLSAGTPVSVGATIAGGAAVAGLGSAGAFTAARSAWLIYGPSLLARLACGDLCNGMGGGVARFSEGAENFATRIPNSAWAGRTVQELPEVAVDSEGLVTFYRSGAWKGPGAGMSVTTFKAYASQVYGYKGALQVYKVPLNVAVQLERGYVNLSRSGLWVEFTLDATTAEAFQAYLKK